MAQMFHRRGTKHGHSVFPLIVIETRRPNLEGTSLRDGVGLVLVLSWITLGQHSIDILEGCSRRLIEPFTDESDGR